MSKHIISLLILIITITSCHQEKQKSTLEIIDLEQAFNKEHNSFFNIHELATEVEYIQLETHDSCLIGNNMQVYVSGNNILTITRRQIFLFDRRTGNFIREIATYGEGPDNYTRAISMFPLDEQNETVTVFANNKRRTYSLNGNILRETIQPEGIFEASEIAPGIFAGFIPNFSGDEKNKIALFNEKGERTGGFINQNQTPPMENSVNIWMPNGWFYKNQSKHYFYELFTDTIYQISPSELEPHVVLFQGKYLPPYEKKNSTFEVPEYFMMKGLYESTKYLFYNFSYQQGKFTMVYDKNDKTIKTYDMEVVPFTLSYINEDNELIGFIEAYHIEDWENRGLLPEERKKSLKNKDEMDNPVIVIGKLKN